MTSSHHLRITQFYQNHTPELNITKHKHRPAGPRLIMKQDSHVQNQHWKSIIPSSNQQELE